MWLIVLKLLYFFETDSESESCACISKAIHQILKVWWTVFCYCGIVCNQHVSYNSVFYLCILFQTWGVEQFSVSSCIQVYTFFRYSKSLFEKQRKEIPKSVGASTQPCLTPLKILDGLNTFSSCCTVPHIFLQKNSMRPFNFGGHSILVRISNKPSLLNRSKAFVKSLNEI